MISNPEKLDALLSDDALARHLLVVMRDGPGTSLDNAVQQLLELGLAVDDVHAAADRIREQSRRTRFARIPRAVIADGIESWYPGARDSDRSWGALKRLLRDEGWDEESLDALDFSSNKVVAQLPDPQSPEPTQCRGLVIGYVQSGKTTNFTAVIAKAADAGYRLFIVLSGMHNGLRLQTQDRLNAQLWEPDKLLWNRLTDEEDFVPTANVDALLSSAEKKTIAVVKKHGQRLRNLCAWLFEATERTLADCPVLIIDDEADQASINTKKPDQDPTVINGLIRDIVNDLPKSAYVGYSATPFANVLLDPANYEDLYPRDFIVDLPAPDDYLGPESIFGREPLEFDEERSFESDHDFIRSVETEELGDLRPRGSKGRDEFELTVTDSLEEALRYFLMSASARRVRRSGPVHATALIHTSQFTDIHTKTASEVSRWLGKFGRQVIERDPGLLGELEYQWLDECRRVRASEFGNASVGFDDVIEQLPTVVSDVRVIVDNSKSEDRLDFDDRNPQVTIAIGGNTLSRGLTLAGLNVSYFVRTASAYDTLLQMGRWFGYRRGYEDFMRVWMTDEMRGWFSHLATVEQEIRYDIDRYTAEHITPAEVGPRIRTHPQLAITAAAKMQAAVRANMSFSGRRLQTILFEHLNAEWLEQNRAACANLLGKTSIEMRRTIRDGIVGFGHVRSELIIQFLSEYQFHANNRDLDSKLITDYILGRIDDRELSHFSVVLMGRSLDGREELGAVDLGLGEPVRCINRSKLNRVGSEEYADIKALMSSTDRVIDLGLDSRRIKNGEFGPISAMRNSQARGGVGDGTGLLALYPISKDSTVLRGGQKTRIPLEAVAHMMGVGIVFPETESLDANVRYMTADMASQPGVDVETADDLDDE